MEELVLGFVATRGVASTREIKHHLGIDGDKLAYILTRLRIEGRLNTIIAGTFICGSCPLSKVVRQKGGIRRCLLC